MIREIRRELSLELVKMSSKQREEFFKGAEEFYAGLKKMERVRASISG
jgi:hypothetical protein